jgi:hypothetical protein
MRSPFISKCGKKAAVDLLSSRGVGTIYDVSVTCENQSKLIH